MFTVALCQNQNFTLMHNHWRNQGRVQGVQPPPIESSEFFLELCVCKMYCPSSAPILIKSDICYRKTINTVDKFDILLQLLGDFRHPDSLHGTHHANPLHYKMPGTPMGITTAVGAFRHSKP